MLSTRSIFSRKQRNGSTKCRFRMLTKRAASARFWLSLISTRDRNSTMTPCPDDGMYPLLVQDSTGKVLDGGKKYTITFPKGQVPPAGAFWSVTMYQDHFLVPNSGSKYSVSSWMNPKLNNDGSLTIYMQPTSPGADKELNWLPSSASIPTPTPLMRLYWPLAPALNGS
jgi:hypothetical protein